MRNSISALRQAGYKSISNLLRIQQSYREKALVVIPLVMRICAIPAKKWGDTEIAEQGRSMLVMRARYTSAELTPHQRGWTDAG